jgi:hypothetical protein
VSNPFTDNIREILPEELSGMELIDAESSRLMAVFAPPGLTLVRGDGRNGMIKIAADGRIYGYIVEDILSRPMPIPEPRFDDIWAQVLFSTIRPYGGGGTF